MRKSLINVFLFLSIIFFHNFFYAQNELPVQKVQVVLGEQKEVFVDEVIKNFMIDLLARKIEDEEAILDDVAMHALVNCCQRLEDKYDSLYLQDLLDAFPLLIERYQELVANELKAPRQGVGNNGFAGPVSCDLSTVRVLLNALQVTLNSTLTSIANNATIITNGFNGTYTALNACCNSVNQEFQQTWTILNALFVATGTTIDSIIACYAISLTEAQNITQPGYYCLANDVNGTFTITADNVVLDLNAKTITTGGIVVSPGSNRIIKKGTINNSAVGIILNANVNTTLEYLNITNSPTTIAIRGQSFNTDTKVHSVYICGCLEGYSSFSEVRLAMDDVTVCNSNGIVMTFSNLFDSNISNVTLDSGVTYGMYIETTSLTNLTNVEIKNLRQIGIIVNTSANQCLFENVEVANQLLGFEGLRFNNLTRSTLDHCVVGGVVSTNNSACINIPSGSNNILKSCSVLGCVSNQGFVIGSSTTSVINCIVEGLSSELLTNAYVCSGGTNRFINCIAQGISSSAAGVNGYISSGVANEFSGCMAAGLSSTAALGAGSARGFTINAANNLLRNCNARNISITDATGGNAVGAFFTNAASTTFINCVGQQLTTPGENGGIFNTTESGTDALFIGCTARDCTGISGFRIDAVRPTLIQCQSLRNTTGYAATPLAGLDPVFRDCSAFNNSDVGFSVAGSTTIRSMNCFSAGNGGDDYSAGFPNTQVAGASPIVVASNAEY